MSSQGGADDQREFRCEHCNGKILVPKDLPPTTGPCPHCQKTITSPGPEPVEDPDLDPIFSKPIKDLPGAGGPPPLPPPLPKSLPEKAAEAGVVKLKKAEEEAKAAEERRKAEEEAKAAEERRKAEEEAKAAEERRKAEEEAKAAEERRKAEEEAKAAEERRKAEEEAKAAEERRKAEEEAKAAEERRKAEEAKAAEERRKAEEEAKAAEERRKAEEAKAAEERRKAEEEAKAAEERRKAEEEAKAAEERRKAEEEAKAAEERRKAEEEAKAAEERRKAEEEAKAAEERRKAEEEAKAAEERRKAEEEAKAAEDRRKAEEEESKAAEKRRKAEEEAKATEKRRKAEQEEKAAEERRLAKEKAKLAEKEKKEPAQLEQAGEAKAVSPAKSEVAGGLSSPKKIAPIPSASPSEKLAATGGKAADGSTVFPSTDAKDQGPFGDPGSGDKESEKAKKGGGAKGPILIAALLFLMAGGVAYVVMMMGKKGDGAPNVDAAEVARIREQQYLNKDWEDDAYAVLDRFLKSDTAAGKAAYAVGGSETLAVMDDFYGGGRIDDSDTPASAFSVFNLPMEDRRRGIFMMIYDQPPVFEMSEFFSPLAPLDVQYGVREPDILLASVARVRNFTGEPLRVWVFFRRTVEGLRVDWDTFVQTKYRMMRSFLEIPETGRTGVFRVFIKETVPERGQAPAGTRTYQIFDPAHREDTAKIVVPVDSDVGRALSILNWRGTKQGRAFERNATIELGWSEAETPELILTRFVCWEFLGVGGNAAADGS